MTRTWREPRLEIGEVRRIVSQTFPEHAKFALIETNGFRTETEAGRGCAVLALKQAGCRSPRMQRDALGAPTWPKGFTGSVTHGGGIALAAALKYDNERGIGIGIGIDLEPMRAEFPPRAVDLCFPGRQGERLALLPPGERRDVAYAAFSASEALVKLRHTITGRRPNELEIDTVVDVVMSERRNGPYRFARMGDGTTIWTRLGSNFVLTLAFSPFRLGESRPKVIAPTNAQFDVNRSARNGRAERQRTAKQRP